MAGGKPRHRLFFALVPAASVLAEIERAASELQRLHSPRGRPTRPEQLHLTLAFLGDFDDGDAPERARQAGVQAAAEARAFDFVLDRVDSFAGARPPWFLTGDAAPMMPLQEQLISALHTAGFQPKDDGRVFVPHVTLLRNAHGRLPPTPITPIAWPAREFVLIDSRTAEHRYITMERWPLR